MKNKNIKNKNKNYLKTTFIIIILFCTLLSYQIAFASSITERDLGDFLNQERKAHNLNTLNWNYKLYEAAQSKADDMINDNYFEHYAPDGTSPWYFINHAGYTYKSAGENLAIDFVTAKAVHDAWMASPLHRENILDDKYEDYAIVVKNGVLNGEETTLIVEMFGKPESGTLAATNQFINLVLNYLLGK